MKSAEDIRRLLGNVEKQLKKMQRDKTHKFQDHVIIFLRVIDFYVLFDE